MAVRATKEVMIKGFSMTLEQGLDLENSMNYKIFRTEDFAEGRQPIFKREKPNYKLK